MGDRSRKRSRRDMFVGNFHWAIAKPQVVVDDLKLYKPTSDPQSLYGYQGSSLELGFKPKNLDDSDLSKRRVTKAFLAAGSFVDLANPYKYQAPAGVEHAPSVTAEDDELLPPELRSYRRSTVYSQKPTWMRYSEYTEYKPVTASSRGVTSQNLADDEDNVPYEDEVWKMRSDFLGGIEGTFDRASCIDEAFTTWAKDKSTDTPASVPLHSYSWQCPALGPVEFFACGIWSLASTPFSVIQHPLHKGAVKPRSVTPLLPDMQLWHHPKVVVQFIDSVPIPVEKLLAEGQDYHAMQPAEQKRIMDNIPPSIFQYVHGHSVLGQLNFPANLNKQEVSSFLIPSLPVADLSPQLVQAYDRVGEYHVSLKSASSTSLGGQDLLMRLDSDGRFHYSLFSHWVTARKQVYVVPAEFNQVEVIFDQPKLQKNLEQLQQLFPEVDMEAFPKKKWARKEGDEDPGQDPALGKSADGEADALASAAPAAENDTPA
eukprot:gene9742-1752_t